MTDESPPGPRPPRVRLYAVTGILLAGAIGIVSSTQPWIEVTLRDGADPLQVAGADALPVLAPLSLAALALGLVLPIVGAALRYVFAALALIMAAALAFLTGQLLLVLPESAFAGAVTDATGITGGDSVTQLVAHATTTAWPWAALVGWTVMSAAAVFALATAARWRTGGRRFRAEASAGSTGPLDPIDSWDDLSRGTDPTR